MFEGLEGFPNTPEKIPESGAELEVFAPDSGQF
jgi:hypothetical protein